MKTLKTFQFISAALIILTFNFNFTASADGKRAVLLQCYSPIGEVLGGYGNDCPTGSGNCIVRNCSTKPSISAD